MRRDSAPWLSEIAGGWSRAEPGELSRAHAEARASRADAVDLITANGHDHGLVFPREIIEQVTVDALRRAESVHRYDPDPLGQPAAREAIAGFYRRRGAGAHPDGIALTPGTSLAYLYTFRLLAGAGHEILVPSPGYPLFDDIAALAGLQLRRYHLRETDSGWRPDLDEIAFQLTPRTRALVIISPHNPTGTVWSHGDLDALRMVCPDLPLVFDEVFSETIAPPLEALPRPQGFPLCITLNGFSKMLALPGWKFGWMKIDGEPERTGPFLRALTHLADTFLPVPELQQAMIPGLIAAADPAVSRALAAEVARRRSLAVDLLSPRAHRPQGGVYLCPRLPEGVDDDDFALRLAQEHAVLVHPGHYYGLPRHAVLTCLATPGSLRDGLDRFNRAVRSA